MTVVRVSLLVCNSCGAMLDERLDCHSAPEVREAAKAAGWHRYTGSVNPEPTRDVCPKCWRGGNR